MNIQPKYPLKSLVQIIDPRNIYSQYETMAKKMNLRHWSIGNTAFVYKGYNHGLIVSAQLYPYSTKIIYGVLLETGKHTVIIDEIGLKEYVNERKKQQLIREYYGVENTFDDSLFTL